MKSYKYGAGVKIAAFVLCLIMTLAAFVSFLGVGYLALDGYYHNDFSFYNTELCRQTTSQYAGTVYNNYRRLLQQDGLTDDDRYRLNQYEAEFAADKTNFIFTLTDSSGKVLLGNYQEQDFGYHTAFTYGEYVSGDSDTTRLEHYTLNCYVKSPLSADDDYSTPFALYQKLYSLRYTLIATAAATLLLALVLFVFLMRSAGRRKGSEEIILGRSHKAPLDLYAAGLIVFVWLLVHVQLGLGWSWNGIYGFLLVVPISFIVLAASAAGLGFLMNLAARVKKGRWWENTVIYRLLRWIYRIFSRVFAKLPMIWKAALLIAGYLLLNVILTAAAFGGRGSAAGALLWLLLNLGAFTALCALLLQLKRLKRAGELIAAGDYDYEVDTQHLRWDIREHAETLNNIGRGMSAAVENRLKSERLKTELITNVSHDIKTPLTSIVNYIDLLKREDVGGETAAGYIEVLDRQSMKLKKLTDDLLEASKASTGNISVTLERTDLVELVNQAAGEYASNLEAARLETVLRADAGGAVVNADGKLLWRVFDNLLDNICRYSQPETRVYITVGAQGGEARVTLMNISRYPLNIPADELTERFIRGDSSRSTDGSGLGLAIVRSLTELMKGRFELSIEGDLFKVTLGFQSAP